jgi:ATP-binding cassette subfamily B protein
MGVERSLGGLPRTFGLQRQFEPGRRGPQGEPVRLERSQLRRIVRYFTPYWRQWLGIFGCLAVSAGIGVLPPQCVRGILDRAIPQRDPRLLALLVLAIIALNLVSGLIGVLQNFLSARVAQGIACDLRNALFQHLQRLSLQFYTTTRAGEIVSRLSSDVAAVQGTATGTFISIASNLLTVGATLAVIFAMNWRLALLSVVVVPALYLPTRLVGRIRKQLSRETQEAQAAMVAFMQERLHVGGMLLAQLFGQAPADAAIFHERTEAVKELHVRQAMAGRWLFMCLSVFSVAGPALIYWYGGRQAIQGDLSVGTLIAFVAYLTSLYRPLTGLANIYVDVQGALAIFERIFEFLDVTPEVTDRPGAVELAAVAGAVQFEGVSFAYPRPPSQPPASPQEGDGRPADALTEVSFAIRPGERVALVGPSGAGKTTISYLLPRFYDPTAGRITLDGHDLREVTLASLRAQIGMVMQETFLFHASIRENLLYARPGATEVEMVAAARAANLHDFIAGLPEGYDTVIGERGFRLSGGEKQRLAIARALLKDPRILVLDEATSNLDATSEFLIQQAFETLLEGRTSLVIAHRLSTVLNADRILVLDRGRLVESGRHEELLAQGGLYATLFNQQFRKLMAPASR